MAKTKEELRTTRRIPMRLPLSVKVNERERAEVSAETKDVSSRGVFFYVDWKVRQGASIEFVLTLPPEITLTDSMQVRCSGKVVRVDESPGRKFGIAAMIDHYDILPSGAPAGKSR
jgi:hypothetical protein